MTDMHRRKTNILWQIAVGKKRKKSPTQSKWEQMVLQQKQPPWGCCWEKLLLGFLCSPRWGNSLHYSCSNSSVQTMRWVMPAYLDPYITNAKRQGVTALLCQHKCPGTNFALRKMSKHPLQNRLRASLRHHQHGILLQEWAGALPLVAEFYQVQYWWGKTEKQIRVISALPVQTLIHGVMRIATVTCWCMFEHQR